jgi:hypothetical protein
MKSLALGLCFSCLVLVSQSALGSEVTLPPGTAVSVKLADTIDSARDTFGKQYSASVAAPVDIGGQTIAAGSRASIVLIHNNSGWITQLRALTVNGRTLQVSSGAGALVASAEANKPSPTASMLDRIGLAVATAPVSNQRVLLPPATELRFVLIGSATPARAIATTPRPRTAARTNPSTGEASAESRQEPGIPYLCRARDRSDRILPTSYYVADVFETSDDPKFVEKRWHEFLIATYPYRFANNPHAVIQCTRLPDLASERDARKQLEGELNSGNTQVVETRWHYTLGPPPAAPTKSAAAPPSHP